LSYENGNVADDRMTLGWPRTIDGRDEGLAGRDIRRNESHPSKNERHGRQEDDSQYESLAKGDEGRPAKKGRKNV
jgi:hypothetical protein